MLTAHQVDFIVVGGVCGTLHGSPVNTEDLDVVHSRQPENLSRLTAALVEIQAFYRFHHNREIRPPLSALSGPGHNLLTSVFGNLDVLGAIGDSLSYDDLLSRTETKDLGNGLTIRVLDLPALIETKKQAGRPKDRYHLLHLKELLREREKLGSS